MSTEYVERGLLTPPILRNLDQRVVSARGSGLSIVDCYFTDDRVVLLLSRISRLTAKETKTLPTV